MRTVNCWRPFVGIRIELENPAKSFLPGQLVSGEIVVENVEGVGVEVTELKITLEGKGKVSWPERVTRRRGKVATVFCTSEVLYLKKDIILVGFPSGGRRFKIFRGVSRFPFQCLLPDNLPSSFVSQVGNVSYRMEANLSFPRNRVDVTHLLPFTVGSVVDLNKVAPRMKLSCKRKKFKPMSCLNVLSCTSGPVGFLFKMPKSGFVPGERIEFLVELTNHSRRSVYWMKIILIQICRFHANGKKSKVTTNPLKEVTGLRAGPGESEFWSEQTLTVPTGVPPTTILTTDHRLIDIQYQLKLVMTSHSKRSSIMDEVPITIGTIPFETPTSKCLSVSSRAFSSLSSLTSISDSKLSSCLTSSSDLSSSISSGDTSITD